MNAVRRESPLFELGNLIFHQRDERTDDERCPSARDPGQLEAQRLTGSSRHNQQGIFALNHSATNRFLVWTKRGKSEGVLQEARQRMAREWHCRICRFRLNLGPWRSCGRSGPDSLCGDSRLPDFAHDLPHVIFDALKERLQRLSPALDPFEVGFPLASHCGALDLDMDNFDEPDAFVGCLQAFSIAHYVAALEQHFDDGRTRCRSAETSL